MDMKLGVRHFRIYFGQTASSLIKIMWVWMREVPMLNLVGR